MEGQNFRRKVWRNNLGDVKEIKMEKSKQEWISDTLVTIMSYPCFLKRKMLLQEVTLKGPF